MLSLPFRLQDNLQDITDNRIHRQYNKTSDYCAGNGMG